MPGALTRMPLRAALGRTGARGSGLETGPGAAGGWWRELDSNQRRHCQQIYSLSSLTT